MHLGSLPEVNLIPTTVEELKSVHIMGCLTKFFCLNMISLSRTEQEFLFFDKEGE